MRSKTSYFNLTLCWKTVCRFWPIWAVFALTQLMSLPMSLGGAVSRAISYGSDSGLLRALRCQPMDTALGVGLAVSAVFSLFAAMGVYSHLYSPRSAGAYAALPLKREGVFASVTLAGIAPLLIIDLVVFAVAVIVEASYGVVYMPALWTWLAVSSMELLFFFGFAALCAQLTGTLVVLPIVYAVLNFTAYGIEYMVRGIFSLFIYGYTNSATSGVLDYFSPAVGISMNCGVSNSEIYPGTEMQSVEYSFYGWDVLGVYAAIGAALLVCAVLLYRRRRMETAGDVVAVRALRPVFKYCLAGGCALALGLLLYVVIFDYRVTDPLTGPAVFTALMLVGCFIGYFAAEMLLRKSFNVFRGRVWVGFAVTCALVIAFMVSCETDLWGYEKKVPAADSVERVTLDTGGDSCTLEDADAIADVLALHGSIIANKGYHEDPDGENIGYLNLRYTLKDGSTLRRVYYLCYDEGSPVDDLEELERIINTPAAIAARKATVFPITAENITYANVEFLVYDPTADGGYVWENLELTPEEANELYYTCILPDIADCSLGRVWLISDADYYNTVYDSNIYFDCVEYGGVGQKDDLYQSFRTTPTVDSFRTNQWLLDHDVPLNLVRWYEENPDSVYADSATVEYVK